MEEFKHTYGNVRLPSGRSVRLALEIKSVELRIDEVVVASTGDEATYGTAIDTDELFVVVVVVVVASLTASSLLTGL